MIQCCVYLETWTLDMTRQQLVYGTIMFYCNTPWSLLIFKHFLKCSSSYLIQTNPQQEIQHTFDNTAHHSLGMDPYRVNFDLRINSLLLKNVSSVDSWISHIVDMYTIPIALLISTRTDFSSFFVTQWSWCLWYHSAWTNHLVLIQEVTYNNHFVISFSFPPKDNSR